MPFRNTPDSCDKNEGWVVHREIDGFTSRPWCYRLGMGKGVRRLSGVITVALNSSEWLLDLGITTHCFERNDPLTARSVLGAGNVLSRHEICAAGCALSIWSSSIVTVGI